MTVFTIYCTTRSPEAFVARQNSRGEDYICLLPQCNAPNPPQSMHLPLVVRLLPPPPHFLFCLFAFFTPLSFLVTIFAFLAPPKFLLGLLSSSRSITGALPILAP